MRLVLDIEANGLKNPTKVWCIVCEDIDTGEVHTFRKVSDDEQERQRFVELASQASLLVGHSLIEYDLAVLRDLVQFVRQPTCAVLDTLILSRMLDFSRVPGHSIEAYGNEFGTPKLDFRDFSKFSDEMVTYCERDVKICRRIYAKYRRFIDDPAWERSIRMEHDFQELVNNLHTNGFYFNSKRASELLAKLEEELGRLDKEIQDAFPPREILIREFTPKATKFGTISKQSVPKSLWEQIHSYEIGQTYRHTKQEPFNPSSHKQLIEILWEAGWSPTDKTKTHIETDRALNRLKYQRNRDPSLDSQIDKLYNDLERLRKSGWKINETNLDTLPIEAPSPARALAKRILLESRRRTLTEWLNVVDGTTNRIHGKFLGIGAWTHRMAHQNPNTANIPSSTNLDGSPKLLGKEMRSLWSAPRNRLLIGVDAEGIQLRIFAHYINDEEFTDALVSGRKEDKTDPHSLNQRIIGPLCKSRAAAKRFIYALLLGAGLSKLAEILECSKADTQEALDRLLERYTGWQVLKQEKMPVDARRGYFRGLDGRFVRIPGDTESQRKHLCMSGYLQNGEAIVMKMAALRWHKRLQELPPDDVRRWLFVNMVHDEWQTEVANSMEVAVRIAKIQADSLREVGEELELKCPLAGSYYNDDIKDYTIGINWYQTH